MKDKYSKNKIKNATIDWNDSSQYENDTYENFEQITKRSKKFKDDTKDISRGKKLNKRSYR